MKKTFQVSVSKIRKITLRLMLKRKLIIALLIVMFGSLAFFVYCLIIGNFVDSEAFQYAYSSLSLFCVMVVGFLISIYINLFKRIPGKRKSVATYEYEFSEDNVTVKVLPKNALFILNKRHLKNHYVVSDVLVVVESFYFFFPDDEEIKHKLGLS